MGKGGREKEKVRHMENGKKGTMNMHATIDSKIE